MSRLNTLAMLLLSTCNFHRLQENFISFQILFVLQIFLFPDAIFPTFSSIFPSAFLLFFLVDDMQEKFPPPSICNFFLQVISSSCQMKQQQMGLWKSFGKSDGGISRKLEHLEDFLSEWWKG